MFNELFFSLFLTDPLIQQSSSLQENSFKKNEFESCNGTQSSQI